MFASVVSARAYSMGGGRYLKLGVLNAQALAIVCEAHSACVACFLGGSGGMPPQENLKK